VPALAKIVGSGAAGVIIVLLIGSLLLSMISSTADGSRALYGIARDDMTIKQLFHLNRYHVPARAMSVDLVVNVMLVLFIANNLAILYLSNIGYVRSHVFALSGFLLLRRDRPRHHLPRRGAADADARADGATQPGGSPGRLTGGLCWTCRRSARSVRPPEQAGEMTGPGLRFTRTRTCHPLRAAGFRDCPGRSR
jgi:hypothetical protein